MDAQQFRPLRRVISGGQTGADQAGLRAARAVGLQTGGWATRDFWTSKGREPLLGTVYDLKEITLQSPFASVTPSMSLAQQYVLRSQRNVDEADGTLVFRLQPSVGTDKTIGYALTKRWSVPSASALDQCSANIAATAAAGKLPYRPCLVVRTIEQQDQADVVAAIVQFIRQNNVQTLNIAGHRDESAGRRDFCQRVESILLDVLVQASEAGATLFD